MKNFLVRNHFNIKETITIIVNGSSSNYDFSSSPGGEAAINSHIKNEV